MTTAAPHRAGGPLASRASIVALAAGLCGVGFTLAQSQPLVTITGGPDTSRQNYTWRVTNHHNAPIVFIEFPHYRGDNFAAPRGWKIEWKNRMMLGARDAPGWCRVSVETGADGIAPGRSAQFGMRLARGGAPARPGRVTVRFADGTEYVVPGVILPTRPGFWERNIMSIGLGVIFVIVVAVHLRRRAKANAAASGP